MPTNPGRFVFVIVVVLTLIAVPFFSEVVRTVGPVTVRFQWAYAQNGQTRVIVPPFGEAWAQTHWTPLRLDVTLKSVDLAALQSLFADDANGSTDGIGRLPRSIVGDVQKVAGQLILHSVAMAAVISALLTMLAGPASAPTSASLPGPWSMRRWLPPIVLCVVLISALFGATWHLYDADAFSRPVYRGALQSLPWLIDAIGEGVAKSALLEDRFATLTNNLFHMYDQITTIVPPLTVSNADVAILHVSDLHLYPAAPAITRHMAETFDVDFIIHTGDVTEFGTELEAEYLRALSNMPVPHLFVTGNHESPEIVERIVMTGEMTLLDGRVVTVADVTVMGVGDPAAALFSAVPPTPAESRQIALTLNRGVSAMTPRPDIIALHNFRTAENIQPGLVPLVVYGHSHTAGVVFREGTAYVNAGTTGGAGLRGIEASDPVTLSLAVIYLKARHHGISDDDEIAPAGRSTTDARRYDVIAVDIIGLSPVAGGFSLERHLAPVPEGLTGE